MNITMRTDGVKELTCTVCGTNSPLQKYSGDSRIYRCPSCDHCFSHLNLDSEEYSQEYFNGAHRNWFNNPNIELFETILGFIEKYKDNASIIDIGCGKGDFLKYIHQKTPAFSLTGLDLSRNSPSEGIEFLQGDIFTMNLNRQYDVVVNIATIEHIPDVRIFMKKVCDLCIPGGLVIITTINDRSILYETARLLYCFGYKNALEQLYSKHHVNHFNISSLNRLVEKTGLSGKRIFMHNMPLAGVDIHAHSPIRSFILRAGVWSTFILGRLTGRTFLQTVICQKDKLS